MRGDRRKVMERIVNTAVGVSGLVSGIGAKRLANKATEGLTPPTYNGEVPKCWEEKGKETIKKAFDDEREPVGAPHAAGLKKGWGRLELALEPGQIIAFITLFSILFSIIVITPPSPGRSRERTGPARG